MYRDSESQAFIESRFGMPPLMPLMPLAWVDADASKANANPIDIPLFIAFSYGSLPPPILRFLRQVLAV